MRLPRVERRKTAPTMLLLILGRMEQMNERCSVKVVMTRKVKPHGFIHKIARYAIQFLKLHQIICKQ